MHNHFQLTSKKRKKKVSPTKGHLFPAKRVDKQKKKRSSLTGGGGGGGPKNNKYNWVKLICGRGGCASFAPPPHPLWSRQCISHENTSMIIVIRGHCNITKMSPSSLQISIFLVLSHQKRLLTYPCLKIPSPGCYSLIALHIK